VLPVVARLCVGDECEGTGWGKGARALKGDTGGGKQGGVGRRVGGRGSESMGGG